MKYKVHKEDIRELIRYFLNEVFGTLFLTATIVACGSIAWVGYKILKYLYI